MSNTNKLFESFMANLNEARNSENDEANDLIRKSLDSDEYARNHASELEKHGIRYIPGEDGDIGALEGKYGRRLGITNVETDGDFTRNVNYKTSTDYNKAYSKDYDEPDDADKSYYDSEDYEKTVAYGTNSQQDRRNLAQKSYSKPYNSKVSYLGTDDNVPIHPDTDLKSFLNAKKPNDREKPRFKYTSGKNAGTEIDSANNTSRAYLANKDLKHHNAGEKATNKELDKRDLDRIEYMKQQAAKEKAYRDSITRDTDEEIKNTDAKINDKLNAYRRRMSQKK